MNQFFALFLALLPALSPAAQEPASPDGQAWKRVALAALDQVKQGKLADAAETGKRALELARAFGPQSLELAEACSLMGHIYFDWAHCDDSLASYTHAIAILRQRREANSRLLFESTASLIAGLCECANVRRAQKALHTYEAELKAFPGGPLDEARLLSLRAAIAWGGKRYARAEELLRRTIDLYAHVPGPVQPNLAVNQASLAAILWQQGRASESLAISDLSIAYFENNAPKHPTLVVSLNNAACALAQLNRNVEAERMFQRAIAGATELYGEMNPVPAGIMLSYARFLRKTKESRTAEYWQQRGSNAFRSSVMRDKATVDVEALRANRK